MSRDIKRRPHRRAAPHRRLRGDLGRCGAWSAAYGIAIVLANFALSPSSSPARRGSRCDWLMGATLFGYILRLGFIFLAV